MFTNFCFVGFSLTVTLRLIFCVWYVVNFWWVCVYLFFGFNFWVVVLTFTVLSSLLFAGLSLVVIALCGLSWVLWFCFDFVVVVSELVCLMILLSGFWVVLFLLDLSVLIVFVVLHLCVCCFRCDFRFALMNDWLI